MNNSIINQKEISYKDYIIVLQLIYNLKKFTLEELIYKSELEEDTVKYIFISIKNSPINEFFVFCSDMSLDIPNKNQIILITEKVKDLTVDEFIGIYFSRRKTDKIQRDYKLKIHSLKMKIENLKERIEELERNESNIDINKIDETTSIKIISRSSITINL